MMKALLHRERNIAMKIQTIALREGRTDVTLTT